MKTISYVVNVRSDAESKEFDTLKQCIHYIKGYNYSDIENSSSFWTSGLWTDFKARQYKRFLKNPISNRDAHYFVQRVEKEL